jgi:ATP-dependent Clp protease ATP-binding subunit ClpC
LRERKDAALAAMQEPGFWEDEGRFAALHEAEYLDRLETAYETSARLGERLSRQAGKENGAGELAGILALRLYVLQSAIAGLNEGRTADLYLRLRLTAADGSGDEAVRWLEDLAAMYVAWAERRGMRLQRLSPDEHLYAISGLGAEEILSAEAGLHLLELAAPSDNGEHVERVHVRVELARSAFGPGDGRSAAAEAELALEQAPASTTVVRRYRFKPAPLVRDAVRGYRTGRIDRVLAGDFDLY